MLHRNTKIITSISIGLFLMSIIVGGFFLSLLSKQKVYFENLIDKQKEEQEHRRSLLVLSESIAKNAEDRMSLQSRVIPEEGVIGFLSFIESLGKEQSVVLTTQSISVEPISAMFESLVIHISLQGPYESIIRTVKLLERIPYQATIYNLQIHKESKGGDTLWGGSLELKVTKFTKI